MQAKAGASLPFKYSLVDFTYNSLLSQGLRLQLFKVVSAFTVFISNYTSKMKVGDAAELSTLQ